MIRCKQPLPLILCLLSLSPATRAQMPTVKVTIATARTVEMPHTVTLVGTVRAVRTSRVASEIAGIVEDMPVREGDRVDADGAILCRLNDDLIHWSLAEARSRREALRAAYEELRAGTRPEDLAVLKAALDEARADVERWRFEVERVEGLSSGRASNPKELTDARAEYAIALARLASAQAAYDKGVAGPRTFEIDRARHDLEAQNALVRRLERDLEKTELRAPFAGAVLQRFVEKGEWIGAGNPVVELADLSSVLVRVDAPESAYPYLMVGEPARVMIDALGSSMPGRIRYVIPRAAEDARTIPVDIEIDNAEGRIADGMFARAIVRAGPKETVVAVPKDALVERSGSFYIATVQPGRGGMLTGMLHPVTLGAETDEWIAITSQNVKPGTVVIVRGTERMAPFPMPVELVDELGRPVESPFGKPAPQHHRETANDDASGASQTEHGGA